MEGESFIRRLPHKHKLIQEHAFLTPLPFSWKNEVIIHNERGSRFLSLPHHKRRSQFLLMLHNNHVEHCLNIRAAKVFITAKDSKSIDPQRGYF